MKLLFQEFATANEGPAQRQAQMPEIATGSVRDAVNQFHHQPRERYDDIDIFKQQLTDIYISGMKLLRLNPRIFRALSVTKHSLF